MSTKYRLNRNRNACSVEGCDRPFRCSGYCGLHYSRMRNKGDAGQVEGLTIQADRPARTTTEHEAWCYGCEKMVSKDHFAQRRAICKSCARELYQRKPCPDCAKSIDIRADRCRRCWGLSRRGVPTKTGRHTAQQGYVILTGQHDHPNARRNGQVAEHVIVMSQKLGRPLIKGENVHHINGVRSDNRPENLELWIVSQPAGQRATDLVAWAKDILARYDS